MPDPSPDLQAVSPEQIRLLLEVSRLLAVTTELDPLLTRIAEAACQLLGCERSSIFVHDPATNELVSRVALGVGSAAGGAGAGAGGGTIRVRSDRGIVGAVFTSNAVLHVSDPYNDPRFNPDVDRQTGFRTRDLLAAPMVDLGRKPVGVIQALNTTAGRAFDATDAAMIQLLADQAGVAIQRYGLQEAALAGVAMRREMDLARKVQDAMLPRTWPALPGFEPRGWTKPASVTGGDTFDFWLLPDGRLGIFLADAAGHGLAPTLVVSQVRTLIRSFSDIESEPRKLLERANARLAQDLQPGQFVTAFVGVLGRDGTLHWCSAGHGPILHRASGDAPLVELKSTELPLGVLPEFGGDGSPAPVRLEPGGALAVVSDGIFEAPDPSGEQFQMDRVIGLLNQRKDAPSGEAIDALCAAVRAWQTHDEPHDDQTIVVVRRTG
jgi:phosphoserine phosphatase